MRKRLAATSPALPSLEEDRALLRRMGLRSTGPRLAVLAFVRAAGRPVSHPEVAAALEPRGFDRASLYRNLIDLTDNGILSRRDFGDRVWRFDLRAPTSSSSHDAGHAHFVCTDCGDIECLPDEAVRVSRSLGKRAVAVEVKGLCQACGH